MLVLSDSVVSESLKCKVFQKLVIKPCISATEKALL